MLKAVQPQRGTSSPETTQTPESLVNAALGVCGSELIFTAQTDRWPRWDLNQPTSATGISSEPQLLSSLGGAESGAVGSETSFNTSAADSEQPISPLVSALLALARQLSPAERAALAALLLAEA
jgi:hypothetical protein